MKYKKLLAAIAMGSLIPLQISASCEEHIPQGSHWRFARIIVESNQTRVQKARSFVRACTELNTKSENGEWAQTSQTFINKALAAAGNIGHVFNQGLGSFSVLGGTEVERQFMEKLTEIKDNPNPVERIQAVYELVAKYQGEYDVDKDGNPDGLNVWYSTPGQLLNKAEEHGSAGVCRDFANLLYWSLMQVARPTNAKNNMGALDAQSFSVTSKGAHGQRNGRRSGHSWIRINLPREVDGGLEFDRFDLDTTWYPNQFVPLMPRHQGLTEERLAQYYDQCMDIVRCVGSTSEQPQSTTPPTSRSIEMIR